MQFGDHYYQSTTCFVTTGSFFLQVLRLIYFLQREDSLLFCFKNSWPNTFASGSEYKVAVVVAFFIHTVTTDNTYWRHVFKIWNEHFQTQSQGQNRSILKAFEAYTCNYIVAAYEPFINVIQTGLPFI